MYIIINWGGYMRTAVVTVGKELLTGRTVNTNLRTIAMKLKSIGIKMCF